MERLLFFWSQYVFVLIGLVTLELEEEIKKTAFLRFHLQPEMAFHVAHDMIYQLSNLTSAWDSVLTGRELLFSPKYIDWNNPEMSRSYSLLYHWPLALDLSSLDSWLWNCKIVASFAATTSTISNFTKVLFEMCLKEYFPTSRSFLQCFTDSQRSGTENYI